MRDDLLMQIDALTEQIKKMAPEAQIHLTGETFEDERANLEVYPPLSWTEQECRNLQREISGIGVDILLDTGYLILVYVCKPEQLVIEAEHRLKRAKQEVEAAEQILAEAYTLGIAPNLSRQAEIVPV